MDGRADTLIAAVGDGPGRTDEWSPPRVFCRAVLTTQLITPWQYTTSTRTAYGIDVQLVNTAVMFITVGSRIHHDANSEDGSLYRLNQLGVWESQAGPPASRLRAHGSGDTQTPGSLVAPALAAINLAVAGALYAVVHAGLLWAIFGLGNRFPYIRKPHYYPATSSC